MDSDININKDELLSKAIHHRIQGENVIAVSFISKCLDLCGLSLDSFETVDSSNFIQIFNNLIEKEKILVYKLIEEMTINAFYINSGKKLGLRLSELLLFCTNNIGCANINKNMIHNNELFYLNKLDIIKRKQVQCDMPFIDDTFIQRYNPLNPSIIKIDNGYMILCRGVNYNQTNASDYKSMDKDGMIRTRNFIVLMDINLNKISQSEIVDKSVRDKLPTRVLGLEDCHLVKIDDTAWFTCTTLDTNPVRVPQISLCKLPTQLDENGNCAVTELTPLNGPNPNRCEKNWLPFSHEDKLAVIYHYNPITIKLIEFDELKPTGNTNTAIEREIQYDFSRFRGSAGPIDFNYKKNEGKLAVIHEVIFRNDGRRYFHRFIWFDQNYDIKAVSYPWYMDHIGIEFCKALVNSHMENEILLGVGIEDKEAWIYHISKNIVHEMLHNIESL